MKKISDRELELVGGEATIADLIVDMGGLRLPSTSRSRSGKVVMKFSSPEARDGMYDAVQFCIDYGFSQYAKGSSEPGDLCLNQWLRAVTTTARLLNRSGKY